MFSLNLKMYDIFRKDLDLPDDKARELTITIDELLCNRQDEKLNDLVAITAHQQLESKVDALTDRLEGMEKKFTTKADLLATEVKLKDQIYATRHDLKEDIHLLHVKIEQMNTSLLKAMNKNGLLQFLGAAILLAIFNYVIRR